MTIQIIGEQTPSTPTEFQQKLQEFDESLIVCWHKPPFTNKPGRWKIERCAKHHGGFEFNGRPKHDHTCNRVYILMCQDDEGVPMPLGEWVFNKLREMRQTWEARGGDTERGVRNALEESDRIDREMDEKREAARTDMIQYNQRDKRLQINKLVNLIEQHDLRPNR